jgi:hypothetical protein
MLEGLHSYERTFDYENWIIFLPNFRKTVLIPLIGEDILLLLAHSKPFETVVIPDSLLYLQNKIEQSCKEVHLPFPWFIRLGSRSPKDSSSCRVNNINEVLPILLESGRIKEGIM